ncbi:MAG: HDOD domain-containing protein [Proteobacteria bacterium]|nr:HDOD domain-containing protein [Pseudomonadota bacterium]MBU1582322.1 HDOD domain-containing protein [Pseudomonadota bacterium]MBU2454168.1 HDOD domain-containing protein [Pseudomonadota bacterium]MBU2629459.1 HDOD domain-containing protein [Pseudomonadota bacterium]
MENQELKKRLSNIKNLPTLPMVANNVIQLTQNPDSTAFEIAEAISQDQSLASKVLKTANSAYYGFPRKITTINYAIVVLGLNNIKNIVLSTSIMEKFSTKAENSLFDQKAFWKHSLLCGILSKKISEHMGIKNSDEIFMCGLLHDFGKLILDSFFSDEFILALQLSKEKNITIMEAENKIFGFNHSGVGSLLLKKWSLPPSLVKAVEFHHYPNESLNAFRIASIVHVADYLCRRIGIGSSGDNVLPALDKKAFKLVNLTSEQIKQMSLQITKEFKTVTGFLYEGGKN